MCSVDSLCCSHWSVSKRLSLHTNSFWRDEESLGLMRSTSVDTICDYWFAQPWHGKSQKMYSICGVHKWSGYQFTTFWSLPVIHCFLCMAFLFVLYTAALPNHYWILCSSLTWLLFFSFFWTSLFNTVCVLQWRSWNFFHDNGKEGLKTYSFHLIYTSLKQLGAWTSYYKQKKLWVGFQV